MTDKILIVDDEKDMLLLLQRILTGKVPLEAIAADDPVAVEGLLKAHDFAVILTDLKMPVVGGMQILEMAKRKDPSTAVIMMTAYGSIESAIEATRKGAFDYVTKPFRKERMLHVVEQALKWRKLQRENTQLKEQLQGRPLFPALVGNSPAMQKLHNQIGRVAGSSATILITGESGTGKELVARAIHMHSVRKEKPFIPIDCSTIPESIIESELFGHVKGAFTGALRDKKGLVEEASQGTLFLDEIGDLNPAMQVKLLRLLQEGEYKVVGASIIRKADIRFVAATNQNLHERIRKGEFREDLFYRLNVINIHLPPLRERKEDIPLLVRHFLEKHNAVHGKAIQGFGRGTVDALMNRDWPGNVRELENVIERSVVMALGDVLEVADVADMGAPPPADPASVRPDAQDPAPLAASEDIFTLPFKEAKDRLMEEFQTQYIQRMLAKHAGNVSQAARESGLKRQYLHRLMRDTQVDSKTFRKSDSETD